MMIGFLSVIFFIAFISAWQFGQVVAPLEDNIAFWF